MAKLYDLIELNSSYSIKKLISSDLINKFALLSGDKNPIHLSESYARKSIFGKRVAHGMLISSFFSKIIGCDFPGEGAILLNIKLSFLKPVYVDDCVSLDVTVTEKLEEKQRLLLDLSGYNSEGILVSKGNALVLYDK